VGLFLTDNQLQSLPEEIGTLVSLKKLQCADNQLTYLPNSMQISYLSFPTVA
jgi:Leucine-rich repeat (LRR) protein